MASNIIPAGIGTATNAEDLFFGASGRVVSRVDIYNKDGSLFCADCPIVSGNVTIDYSRAERRSLELVLANSDGELKSDPNGFWYDKIIRAYRGVEDSSGNRQMYQLGEFYIDQISESNFPSSVSVSGRDSTKLLMNSKFPAATAFAAGQILENIIRSVVINGGVSNSNLNLPTTGTAIATQVLWDAGLSRWEAVKDLAESYGYEVFFDASGVFTMRLFVDPTTAPTQFTFDTGGQYGNLASYKKSTNDSRIYNHVVVKGGNNNAVPVFGSVENNEPSSPTRIDRLSRRTFVYESKLVTTVTQAQDLAASFLRIMALESYELELESLVAPWLDVGVAITFVDPDPAPSAPTRFLLTSLTVPLGVGATMQASAKRVTIIT